MALRPRLAAGVPFRGLDLQCERSPSVSTRTALFAMVRWSGFAVGRTRPSGPARPRTTPSTIRGRLAVVSLSGPVRGVAVADASPESLTP
jgi:hypothetical protein